MISLRKLWQITNIALLTAVLAAVAEFLLGNNFESDSYSRLSMVRLNDDD